MKKNIFKILLMALLCISGNTAMAQKAFVSLKTPGNNSVTYPLEVKSDGGIISTKEVPLRIERQIKKENNKDILSVRIEALDDVYFNYGEELSTGFSHKECLFLMPGFWYRKNLRSPEKSPSFHTSDSWLVREDRLSSPMTVIFDENSGKYMSVLRMESSSSEALTTSKDGEVILSGKTTLGYTGFSNVNGKATLCFGFPYREEPKSYIRKLTLAPSVISFENLKKGESVSLTWIISNDVANDYSDCVKRNWEYSYDILKPDVVDTPFEIGTFKEVLSNYFVESFVDEYDIKYFSGAEMKTSTCENTTRAEIGFVGRTLLNAFNSLEYGEANSRADLVGNSKKIFDSYERYGFTTNGFFRELIDAKNNTSEDIHSIRRQSEGVYAILHYLNYEKSQGRKHPDWEKRMRVILDQFLKLQKEDGSFPRKFQDNMSVIDKSGGSTPSATLPLVMGYVYFKDKKYLDAASRTADYLDTEIISKADYFSSTLDANCEDKEASLYAASALYYLALATRGDLHSRYASLCKKATYFALSWYYLWDVPFAMGQMHGDIGLKSRGWGNVSVENNHIDVFVFEFADVLRWLSKEFKEPRFTDFANVISTSMRQLLPIEGHMCGIAKKGFYPEVVQHTQWDYGKNGKGFYNDIFAPGWTVASLWELFTPGRAENFIQAKKK